MYLVGLTGGMGAGKSTVAAMLADLGAVVIDADDVAREVVAPGEPALDEIVARFGSHLRRADGTLDRSALAAVVFADDEALRELEAITHPRIAARIRERLAVIETADADSGSDTIVVLDHPLLVETGQHTDLPAVVVVTAPLDRRVARLAAGRGIDVDDASARIAAQASDEDRLAVATHVIDNDADVDALRARVRRVWDDLEAAVRRRGAVA